MRQLRVTVRDNIVDGETGASFLPSCSSLDCRLHPTCLVNVSQEISYLQNESRGTNVAYVQISYLNGNQFLERHIAFNLTSHRRHCLAVTTSYLRRVCNLICKPFGRFFPQFSSLSGGPVWRRGQRGGFQEYVGPTLEVVVYPPLKLQYTHP